MTSPPSSPEILPCPELDVRWVHAGAQHLDLLPTPITSSSTIYKSFSPEESKRIDDRWFEYSEEERREIIEEWGLGEGEGSQAKAKKEKEKEKVKDNVKAREISPDVDTNARGDVSPTRKEELRSGEELATAGETHHEAVKRAQKEYEDLELISGVPVSQDSLFEVSLKNLSLHPVFWAHTGARVPVLRGTWFVTDETRPCGWDLGDEIEKGYLEIKPWQPSYKHELATAIALGPAAEEKLKYNLPAEFGQGLGVIFEDENKGRLITTGTFTYLSRAFWSTLRTKPSGTYVYRGYSAALAASGKDETPRSRSNSTAHSRKGSFNSINSQSNTPSKPVSLLREHDKKRRGSLGHVVNNSNGPSVDEKKKDGEGKMADVKDGIQSIREDLLKSKERIAGSDNAKAMEEENVPVTDAFDNDLPCTDLILVIHGIGQQLAAQYESYNFVYAGNQLRQVIGKQSHNPALASIIRDRRCQVLPVQWRASLILDDEATEEDKVHGMDNRFSMADITINKSIPYVRELTNAVLLDIPLFMSHHRQKMIEAVCLQANKLYRLWIARNPEFEKSGRVHIIGHSLGSALAAHILSNQPTKMPGLSELPKQVITGTKDRFLFNTSNLFLCGSPLGIFLHLDQAQLMPRKGRERTMHSPQDEALDRSGKFGCMAIDSLYNIFYYTDPIAYQLNAAVDAKLATRRSPLAITSVTAPFYSSVSEGFNSISQYLPAYLGGGTGEKKKPQRPGVIRLPSGIEMSGPNGEERLEGSRGERRFSALNPHGNIDFFLPSAGVSEYLDMITAHASYWSDPSFAAFLLAEIYSTRMDLFRTGMGLADQILPEGSVL